jgi:Flp pilus assembly protein protease CpaA
MLRFLGLTIYAFAALMISISDLRYRIIRNRDLLLFFLASLSINYSGLSFGDLRSLFIIALLCVSLGLLFQGKIGSGDLKLFWVISIWTSGFSEWLQGLAMAWILGGLFAMALVILNLGHKQKKTSIPFAPFIFLGFLPVI